MTGRLRVRLLGLACTAGVLALTVGVPFWLQSSFGWPFTIPDAGVWEELQRPLTDEMVERILVLVVWAAWAWWLLAPVLVEAVATLLGLEAPRIPLAGASQSLTAPLVAGVLLLFAPWHAGSRAGPASAPVPIAAVHPVSEESAPAASDGQDAGRTAPAEVRPEGEWYTVVPKDNPWKLSVRFYGRGELVTNLWHANAFRRMPSGRTYTRPGLIRPGDVLFLPTSETIGQYDSMDTPVAVQARAMEPHASSCAPSADGASASPVAEPVQEPRAAPAAPAGPSPSGTTDTAPPAPRSPVTTIREDQQPSVTQETDRSLVLTVRLPSGSVVGTAFAAGFASALAVGAIHRRRAYRPSVPRPERTQPHRRRTEPLRTLERPPLSVAEDEPDDAEATLRRSAPVGRRDPAPMRVEVGVDAEGTVDLDPLEIGSVRLSGEGAEDVVRSTVASLLTRCRPLDLRVLLDRGTAEEVLGIDRSFPGVDVLPSSADVLVEAEVERARRSRVLDSAEATDFRSYRADPTDELLGALLVVARPTKGEKARWAALLSAGPRLGMAGLLLGESTDAGAKLGVDADGTAVVAENGIEGLQGATLHRLIRADAVAALAELAEARRAAERPVPAEPAEPAVEPFPVSAIRRRRGDTAAPVRVGVLGPFTLMVDGSPVRAGLFDTARQVLVDLVRHPEGVSRERILENVWEDVEPMKRQERFSAAVSNLRSCIRRALGRPDAEVVRCEGNVYVLEDELYDVDLWKFHRALGARDGATEPERVAAHLRDALWAYGGEFAHGLPWEWVEPERENLRRRALDVAVQLAVLEEQLGRLDAAIAAVERAVDIVDPYAEELYVRGVALLVRAGRPESARRLYDELRSRLEELDAEPMPTTVAAVGELLAKPRRPTSPPQTDVAVP